jgi:hypothetical protein
MLAPVSIRKLILCFSIVKPRSSFGFMVVIGALIVGPRTHHSVGGSASVSLGTEESMPSNDFPSIWVRVLEVASLGALPPKMTCLSILKTHPWV